MDERSIKDSIRKIRLQTGLSQEAMADEMEIGPSTYSKFESGKKEIICRSLYKFSEVTGRSILEILSGSEGGTLHDDAQMKEALDAQQAFYEKKLSEKDDALAQKEAELRKKEELIISLNDYINLLKNK